MFLSLLIIPAFGQCQPVLQITDVQGAQLNLNVKQAQALKQCKTFKNVLLDADSKDQEVLSYEGNQLAFLTAANITQLIEFIQNPNDFDASNAACIDLFCLANYLEAPAHILGKLAVLSYELVKQMPDQKKNSELENLIHFHLPYYPDFTAFLKDFSDISQALKVYHPYSGCAMLDLSQENLQQTFKINKKIASLKGIEVCSKYGWAKSVTHLNLCNNRIENCDFEHLKEVFPHLISLDLAANRIHTFDLESINNVPTIKHLDMSSNEIQEIKGIIKNPMQFTNAVIDLKNNPDIPANARLMQLSHMQKILNWCKTCGVQGNAVLHAYKGSALFWTTIVFLGALNIELSNNNPLSKKYDLVPFDTFVKHLFKKYCSLKGIIGCSAMGYLATFLFEALSDTFYFGQLTIGAAARASLAQDVTDNPHSIKIEKDNETITYPSVYTNRLF